MELKPPEEIRFELSKGMRRWILFWNITSYILLACMTGLAVLDAHMAWPAPVLPSPLSTEYRILCLAGSFLWGGWYWFFVVDYGRWLKRSSWQALSFVFAILLTFGLSWIHPAYLFLLFGLYGVTFGVLKIRWAVVMLVLNSLMVAWRAMAPDFANPSRLAAGSWVFVYTFIALLLGLWINAIVEQGRERERMIRQLQATQSELARSERQAGILEERQRLAGAIHDTLAQGLTSIVMQLEAAEQALKDDPETARSYLDRARSAARQNLSEARRFVWALQPDVARREPLASAAERVVNNWGQETTINARFALDGNPQPLPAPVEVTLLRALQEGLANIRKHAAASEVDITLTYMQDEVLLDVQDNGIGFDPELAFKPNLENGGYGLFSLRERARELGGKLEIESGPGEGTTLVLELPYTPEPVSQQAQPGMETE